MLSGYLAARAELGGRPLPGEVDLLTVFADLSELSRNRPAGEPRPSRTARCTARASTSTATCRASTSNGPALPEAFQAKLQQVLGHYGVADLDRTPELEAAVFRIFLAQQRMSADVAVVVGAAARSGWPEPPPAGVAARARRARPGAPDRGHPGAVPRGRRDLARGVVFRWFAQPLLRRNRAEVYAAVRADLRHLDRNPDAPDRAERIQAMVASAEPLVRLIGQRIGRPGRDHAPLLEVLTRRYYGNRGLTEVHRAATSRAAGSSPPSTPATAA